MRRAGHGVIPLRRPASEDCLAPSVSGSVSLFPTLPRYPRSQKYSSVRRAESFSATVTLMNWFTSTPSVSATRRASFERALLAGLCRCSSRGRLRYRRSLDTCPFDSSLLSGRCGLLRIRSLRLCICSPFQRPTSFARLTNRTATRRRQFPLGLQRFCRRWRRRFRLALDLSPSPQLASPDSLQSFRTEFALPSWPSLGPIRRAPKWHQGPEFCNLLVDPGLLRFEAFDGCEYDAFVQLCHMTCRAPFTVYLVPFFILHPPYGRSVDVTWPAVVFCHCFVFFCAEQNRPVQLVPEVLEKATELTPACSSSQRANQRLRHPDPDGRKAVQASMARDGDRRGH